MMVQFDETGFHALKSCLGSEPGLTSTHPPILDQLQERVERVPLTLLLIAANLLVFALMLSHGAGLWHSSNSVQLAWGANFGPATKDGEWWRLGSALFLHFGILHLAMNMLSLWEGGRLVERMYGWGRFALIYFGSGLCGNLLSLIAQGDQAVSGGASGAIFGVYGALMVYLWRERGHFERAEFKWLFWGVVSFSVVTIALGLQVTGIDNAAHIGGLLGGLLCGVAFFPGGGRGRGHAAIALVACLSLLLVSIPAPRYRWSEEMQARGMISELLGEDARISARWDALLNHAGTADFSFDQLAGSIETEVINPYEQSFEQLAKLRLNPNAPSATALESLRNYVGMRRDASRALAEGLRAKDPARIREALRRASRARPPKP